MKYNRKLEKKSFLLIQKKTCVSLCFSLDHDLLTSEGKRLFFDLACKKKKTTKKQTNIKGVLLEYMYLQTMKICNYYEDYLCFCDMLARSNLWEKHCGTSWHTKALFGFQQDLSSLITCFDEKKKSTMQERGNQFVLNSGRKMM
jgi:hypothetical protein